MPPVVISWRGRKHLIRGLPTRLLAWLIKGIAQGRARVVGVMRLEMPDVDLDALGVALAREMRERLAKEGNRSRRWFHWCARLDPPACACGGPGLYIVGVQTYCRACHGRARRDSQTHGRERDQRFGEKDAAFMDRMRVVDSARRHHMATGRKRR